MSHRQQAYPRIHIFQASLKQPHAGCRKLKVWVISEMCWLAGALQKAYSEACVSMSQLPCWPEYKTFSVSWNASKKCAPLRSRVRPSECQHSSQQGNSTTHLQGRPLWLRLTVVHSYSIRGWKMEKQSDHLYKEVTQKERHNSAYKQSHDASFKKIVIKAAVTLTL